MRRLTPILVIALMLALTATAALACPLCKESVGSSDAQAAGGVPAGFNNSIFLMLGGLFAVLGMVAFTLIKGMRSAGGAAAPGFPDQPRE
jgi:hypothetical protein